jgi:pimeloyl-ACP methyl ester carboxylesterase
VTRARWRAPYGLNAASTLVDGRPVRSLVAGRASSAPEVVMLPGLGAPGYMAPWALRAAAWTRVALLDLPGWRRGRARACAPTLEGVAEATARWLEATERRRVVLVGHSTGAQALLRVALQVPDRVAGLVLAGPTFDPAARSVPRVLGRAASTLPYEDPRELLAVGPSYLASGLAPMARFIATALQDRPEDLVARVTPPVLVLTGRHDGFAPPSWARELAGVACAPCVVLPGAHNAPFPHPDLADGAVREFVRSLGSTGRVHPRSTVA